MEAFQNKKYFHIEALIVNGYFGQAIRALIPELEREPENPIWFLQALVAASEDCRPDLLNWLSGRRRFFRKNRHTLLVSRALTPGVRVEKSIILLIQAIDLFPENAHLYYLRAKRLRTMQCWQLAVRDLCNVLSLNPGYMIAYLPRASCYFELELYLMAVDDYFEIHNSTTCNHNYVFNLMNQCYRQYMKREKQLLKIYSDFMQSENSLFNNFQRSNRNHNG